MKQELVPARLDVLALAQAGGVMGGHDVLSGFERLVAETKGLGLDFPLKWSVQGELREAADGSEQVWLQLESSVCLSLTCQRCLGPVAIDLAFSRLFRFVDDEATAQAQDELAQEDVLVLSRDFNLRDLIEDEFLMELPAVPRHQDCPTEVKLEVADLEFVAQLEKKISPFAVLAGLNGKKTGQ